MQVENFSSEIKGIFHEEGLSLILFTLHDEEPLYSLSAFANADNFGMVSLYNKFYKNFAIRDILTFFRIIIKHSRRRTLSWICNNCLEIPPNLEDMMFSETIRAGNLEGYNFLVEELYGDVYDLKISLSMTCFSDNNPLIPVLISKFKEYPKNLIQQYFESCVSSGTIENCRYFLENHEIVISQTMLKDMVCNDCRELLALFLPKFEGCPDLKELLFGGITCSSKDCLSLLLETYPDEIDLDYEIRGAIGSSSVEMIEFLDGYSDHKWMQKGLYLAVSWDREELVDWLLTENVDLSDRDLVVLIKRSPEWMDFFRKRGIMLKSFP